MTPSDVTGPVPFGVRDDGTVLDGVSPDAILNSSVWPLPETVMRHRGGKEGPDYGVDETDFDPARLNSCGWAVLFGPKTPAEFKTALKPLLDHREAEVHQPEENDTDEDIAARKKLFRKFDGDYVAGETAQEWLDRQKVSMKTVLPTKGVPYYILIVASPHDIPFEFQYSLDIFWAVGRIWFETAEEFAQYAKSVVAYETAPKINTTRQMAFFCTKHRGDMATGLLTSQVATPLLNGADGLPPLGKKQGFRRVPILGEDAKKSAIEDVLRGKVAGGRPSLLFTGTHGKTADSNDTANLKSYRGALICAEWKPGQPATAEQCLAAEDVPDDAQLSGLIHFMFACYGVGWPKFDNYGKEEMKTAEDYARLHGTGPQISPEPMIAKLPQRLLSHPNGGALAVFGHIDRAWGWSFESESQTSQPQDFRAVLNGIMQGYRIGHATDKFNGTWAALSANIAETLDRLKKREIQFSEKKMLQFANQWVARDDARNYMVFGDPAVRLRVHDMPALPEVTHV